MKKRLLRLSKRILILSLCTCLVSGSVINKYKITANATAAAAALTAFSAQEICMWLGMTILGASGVAAIVDNSDKIVELGKNFVDSMNVDEVSGWILTKVNTAGQSYVYGSEALKEIQDMSFEVIQGGGNKPENNEDNDGDGDIDADDRTVELKNLGLWATSSFANLLCEQVQPIIDKVQAGEQNVISDTFMLDAEGYSGYQMNESGTYVYSAYQKELTSQGILLENVLNPSLADYKYRQCFVYDSMLNDGVAIYKVYAYLDSSSKLVSSTSYGLRTDKYQNGELVSSNYNSWRFFRGAYDGAEYDFSTNLPVFESKALAESFFATGVMSLASNYKPKTYQIADWLQEEWTSTLTQLNTGIRSLNDNMLIVGEAMNQALQNQLNGLGYISAIGEGVAGAVPMSLPDMIADPIYYPGDSSTPALTLDELPWKTPAGYPGTDSGDNDSGSDEGSTSEEEIRGKDPSGIQLLFGTLFDLIMILLMLLMIFLSCLAFIVMIFRIEPTTGFLPEEMVSGLEYLKSLQIPGFGMSVYDFFMALIYIILIFTVIGILRKNIDKLKFPRKGKW